MHGRDVFILDAVRTPIGRLGGALAGIRPDDLAAHTLRRLLNRHPTLEPEWVDEVVLGAANQAGEDNRNVARMAALLAELPVSVPGSTVNRLCASGLDAVISAARMIAVGDASCVIAGGVESMSRAPWILPKPERAYPAGDLHAPSSTLGWRLVNPRMASSWTVSLAEATEQLGEKFQVTREAADAFAADSHHKAAGAWAAGAHAAQMVNLDNIDLERDEGIRDGVTSESLAVLKPVVRAGGSVTAGNASQLSDGAAALILVDEDMLCRLGATPLARIVSSAVSGVDPADFGIGPVAAIEQAIDRAGRALGDVGVLELNEAFATQSVACLGQLPELNPDVVNPQGGAIAMGHPLGCSGARLAGSVAHQLEQQGTGLGVVSLCVGVGQGVAMVLER